MKIIDILNDLKITYTNDCIERSNGTLLLKPGTIPKAKFMLFKKLDQKTIDEFLINEYNNVFPEEYIRFLKFSNGANLFTVKLKTQRFCFAHDMFSIYGLPMTDPFDRPEDMEEPFDLRVEDYARHKKIPSTWLKCGSYIRNYDFRAETDIFIDTTTGNVYACVKNHNKVVDSWENLDKCFCSIYNNLLDSFDEYDFIR